MIQKQLGDIDAVNVQAILFNQDGSLKQVLYNQVKNRNYGLSRQIIRQYGGEAQYDKGFTNSLSVQHKADINLILALGGQARLQ
jgi:hypothetical protein